MNKLVSGETLLADLFDDSAKPSVRWLDEKRKGRAIPYIKIGRMVFYDIDEVKKTLTERFLVKPINGRTGR